jgi:hypothetical protein
MVYGFLAFFPGDDDEPSPPPLSDMVVHQVFFLFSCRSSLSMPELVRHPRTSIYTARRTHALSCESISCPVFELRRTAC